MLRKVRDIALLSALALSSGAVYANNFNYNAFDVNVGGGPTTFGVGGSMQFTDNVHILGKAESKFDGDYDIAAGVGFNGPAGQFADIVGQMLLHNVKEPDDKVLGEDILPELSLGTRLWFVDGIEAHAKVGQLLDGDESHTTWEVGGRFHSTQQLVLGVSFYNGGVYGNQFRMQARFQY